MAGILVYSENSKNAHELLTAATIIGSALGLEVRALSINNDTQAEDLAERCGEVYRIKEDSLKLSDTSAMASILDQVVRKLNISVVLLSSNRRGKELAGRVAQILDSGCLTDVYGIEVRDDGNIDCFRNGLGGLTVVSQVIDTEKKVIAIVPKIFEAMGNKITGVIREVEVDVRSSGVNVVRTKTKVRDAVDIETSDIIVAVGQGLAHKDDLPQVEKLAQLLEGEVACTKPVATDRQWLSEERIIGLSGKKCKPNLAILLGISGQVQFTVGIRDAKTIIAVNTDENANVKHISDYMLVADIKDIIPELIEKIS